jgi:hypothetical protein
VRVVIELHVDIALADDRGQGAAADRKAAVMVERARLRAGLEGPGDDTLDHGGAVEMPG